VAYKTTPKRPGAEAEATVKRGQDAVARRQKTPVKPIIFDQGRPDRPSSSKNDAPVNPRNSSNSGGRPYLKPIILPPVNPSDTSKGKGK